jgi:secreted trypsin-like serine protease
VNCGGTLINERYVLTSGHCISKFPKKWTLSHVKLGGINSTDDVAVVNSIVHDEYVTSSGDQKNDIALLKLEKNVQFTDKIQPICLPVDSADRNVDHSSKVLEVSEYGGTSTANRVELYEVSKDNCNAFYVSSDIEIANSQVS